jgi:iron complex outermembrane receptor protein
MATQLSSLPIWMVRLSLLLLWLLIFALSWIPTALGEETSGNKTSSVIEMSLEDLLNVEITSVSKKAENRTQAPAAIYVLTQEDIRRSGARTVPDALRVVPGIQVAQIDSNRWSVTSRSFTGRFANMLLVMIDGRTIYTPFFAGVYWEGNDVMLEDVDRIEVIRGPGGTLWGANAVNGVINIVTKSAAETQGGLVSILGGTEARASAALRYGGEIGDLGHYRVYGKYSYYDEAGDFIENQTRLPGGEANDDWHNGHAGFRMDLNLDPDDRLTIEGGVQVTATNNTYELPFLVDPLFRRIEPDARYEDVHVLGRWTRRLADDSEIQLQGFYDYYHFDEVTLDEQRHTLDIDFQHRLTVGDRHDLLWGVAYRATADDFENTSFASMDPTSRVNQVFSGFIQDEIRILDTLHVTIGTKVEHNDFTGVEVQPSARFAWTPNERHTLWGAVSRAVRTPSRSENDIRLEYGEASTLPGTFISAFGNRDLRATELLAFELGYRVTPADRVAFDVALFYNDYSNVRTIELGDVFTETDPPPTHDVVPVIITTTGDAQTWGVELGADLSIRPWWLIRTSYSFIDVKTQNVFSSTGVEEVPHNIFTLQNRLDLPRNLEFDTTLRYVDSINTLEIGDYFELDARLAWRPREDLELALVGRNLLNSQHEEYDDIITLSVPTEVQRGIYGMITWRF